MADEYKQRPSSIVGIENDYTAYCFDEACLYLLFALKNNEKVVFDNDEDDSGTNHYTSMEEYYKGLIGVRTNGL